MKPWEFLFTKYLQACGNCLWDPKFLPFSVESLLSAFHQEPVMFPRGGVNWTVLTRVSGPSFPSLRQLHPHLEIQGQPPYDTKTQQTATPGLPNWQDAKPVPEQPWPLASKPTRSVNLYITAPAPNPFLEPPDLCPGRGVWASASQHSSNGWYSHR